MSDQPLKIALAGYRGFIGSSYMLSRDRFRYMLLDREILYGQQDTLGKVLEGVDVVMNLAGSPIAARWSHANKKRIHESRHGINRNLVETVNGLKNKPGMFISASAIAIYSHSGVHDEKSRHRASGFSSDIVKSWEEPLELLDSSVKRVVLRMGIVLGRDGGVLAPLMRTAKTGFLPVMGSGKQVLSFIHIADLHSAIDLIIDKRLEGIFNLCSPNPVDNATFTRILAKAAGARVVFRLPVFFLKLFLGEAHVMITQGQHVLPARLDMEGFRHMFPDIEEALSNLVQRH